MLLKKAEIQVSQSSEETLPGFNMKGLLRRQLSDIEVHPDVSRGSHAKISLGPPERGDF